MSSDTIPVTVPDLRNALALCVAKFESVAAEFRQAESAAIEDAANAQHLEDADSFRADAARARGEAESLDRMAASVRALLRAPQSDKRVHYRIEQYIGAKWEDCAMPYDTLEAARNMCLNAKGASGGLRIMASQELERYREGVRQ